VTGIVSDDTGQITLAELDRRFRQSRIKLTSLQSRDDGGYSIRIVYCDKRYYGTGLTLQAAVQDVLDELRIVSARACTTGKAYTGKQKPGRPRAHHDADCECWYCQRGRKEIQKATESA